VRDLSKAVTEQLLFTYGTLREGECRNIVLQELGAEFLGAFDTEEEWDLVDLGEFPAMVDEGRDSVRGELYLLPIEEGADVPFGILAIDRIEGHPDAYVRRHIRLKDFDRAVVSYIFPRRKLKRLKISIEDNKIPSGDWVVRGDG
jgi:gamma-glutamylcyclotransferase (GGCT)/AIG2-like uncharacterized protein YtfP